MKALLFLLFTIIACSTIGISQSSDALSVITINLNEEHAKDGLSYETNRSRVSNRNGGDGYRGENGLNGNQGASFISNIWKENDSIKVEILNTNEESQVFAYYKIEYISP